jgi:N-acetyl-anhydromuramyl-L-alanine amidase AmpD
MNDFFNKIKISKNLEKKNIYPENIKNHEEIFEETKKDINGILYQIKKDNSFTFPLSLIEPEIGSNYYYPQKKVKSSIVLHYTTGYFRNDIASLTEQECPLSAAYIIGRNGIAYQLYNPEYWALHLGRGAKGGNIINSERSIAIEISNIGPLTRENGYLYNIFNKKYCSIEEEYFFTKLDVPFRKYSYYATFTEEQYKTLQELIAYLCNKFYIPHKILPENKRYRLFSSKDEAQTFEGICTHVNYRAHGKTDIGPGFSWEKII